MAIMTTRPTGGHDLIGTSSCPKQVMGKKSRTFQSIFPSFRYTIFLRGDILRKPYLMTVLIFLLLVIGVGGTVIYANSHPTENEQTSIRSILKKYERAAKNHDVNNMIKFSLDLSWPNQKQFEENLKKLNEDVLKFDTVALEKIETDLYKATVLVQTESLEETQMELPVLNLNGQWKIIVGQDIDDYEKLGDSPTSPTIKPAEFYKKIFS
ncbi:hypothetical protein AB4Z30_25345 [Paenibacillus sp. 2TAF8]|uniref:hypothetical protein n=1 Tax=Paenibacillus sp. 2TAF8 TaxID=3233020 RepID=UPI003F9B2DB9